MSQEQWSLLEESGGLASWYRDVKYRLWSSAEQVWGVAVYTSAYLAVIAAVEVALVTVLLSVPWTVAPLVVGLVTFAVYVADRIADADGDAVSAPRRAAFVRRHADALYVAAAVAYGLAVALSVLGGPLVLGLALLPGLFWVVYASNWVPAFGGGVGRLKDVFLVNSAVVALAWAVTLTLMPLAFADVGVTPTTGVVFVYFFVRVFTNTEIPNVRDVEADRAIGVPTLPVVVGKRRTRQVLSALDLGTAVLVGGAVLAGVLPALLAVPLLAGVGYSLVVTAFVGRSGRERLLARAAECEYVVTSLVLVAVVMAG